MRRAPWAIALLLAATAAPAAPPAPVQVGARSFAEVALYPERDAPASAQSLNESRLAAEVAATIVAIPVEVGQVVKQGEVLLRLDARDFELAATRARAALDAATARLKLAEAQLARARELQGRGFLSPEALNQREAEAEVVRAEAAAQRAQLESARRSLAKATVRAPFPAIVRQRLAHVGELAAPGTPLLALADLSRIEVAAQVQAKDAASLSAAPEVRFSALGRDYAVRLLRVSPAINRDARNIEARLAFTAEAAAPGADGRIRWRDGTPHLPPELVVRREGRLGVFLLENGRARFVPLPQAQEGRPAAADLPRDARIAVDGRHGLADGQPVAAPRP